MISVRYASAKDPVYPLANCIPDAFGVQAKCDEYFVFEANCVGFGHQTSQSGHGSTGPTGESWMPCQSSRYLSRT